MNKFIFLSGLCPVCPDKPKQAGLCSTLIIPLGLKLPAHPVYDWMHIKCLSLCTRLMKNIYNLDLLYQENIHKDFPPVLVLLTFGVYRSFFLFFKFYLLPINLNNEGEVLLLRMYLLKVQMQSTSTVMNQ